MQKFEFTPSCIITKTPNALVSELLKGTFLIGCDLKSDQLVLENVFHFTPHENRLEIFKLHEDTRTMKRNLELDIACVLPRNKYGVRELIKIMTGIMEGYDVFISDEYKNLNTDTVFDKYGQTMKMG